MLIGVYILAILCSSLGYELPEYSDDDTDIEISFKKFDACWEKCSEQDKVNHIVCIDEGHYGYDSRCYFNCMNEIKGHRLKEVECKLGYPAYCWNTECKPEEKDEKENESLCETKNGRYIPGEIFQSVCEIRCRTGYYKTDVSYEICRPDWLQFQQSMKVSREENKLAKFGICKMKCSNSFKEDKRWICIDGRTRGYPSRCEFHCKNKIYNVGNTKKEVEVKCKQGSFEYCWNLECAPEEKKVSGKGKPFCEKTNPNSSFKTVCDLKCASGQYNKTAVYATCS